MKGYPTIPNCSRVVTILFSPFSKPQTENLSSIRTNLGICWECRPTRSSIIFPNLDIASAYLQHSKFNSARKRRLSNRFQGVFRPLWGPLPPREKKKCKPPPEQIHDYAPGRYPWSPGSENPWGVLRSFILEIVWCWKPVIFSCIKFKGVYSKLSPGNAYILK